ncbi:K(+)-transporting ATPase subunit F [Streptomyces sp. F001]|uniref:K(+)-transporting ATPase subunit F n=1 Tax=Streptomyces sp. F001 TaxID=1510026 RepID=UPI00101E6197|nr:K(+)-transporting ATPase subunit F [Streptomyces sp. F001]RZB20140.1 K(+)-transporting ATPase subunit F [Streptomyces sp. F001]
MTAENVVGLIVAIALLAYVVVALIKPEHFCSGAHDRLQAVTVVEHASGPVRGGASAGRPLESSDGVRAAR